MHQKSLQGFLCGLLAVKTGYVQKLWVHIIRTQTPGSHQIS
jgi:hypothetical protein